MRRILLALAVTVLSAGTLVSNRVDAMTLPAPAGLAAAAAEASPVEQAAVVCRYNRCYVVRSHYRVYRYHRPYRYHRVYRHSRRYR